MAAYGLDDEEELEPGVVNGSMEGGVPNVPRNPDDPREKIKEYLRRKEQQSMLRTDPGYREMERAPTEALRSSDRDLALIGLFNQSANQMGTIGGKAASSAPLDQFTQKMTQGNQAALGDIMRQRQMADVDEDRQFKIRQYLADQKMSEEEKLLRRQELKEDKEYRRSQDERNYAQRERQIEATAAQQERKAAMETPEYKQRASAGEDIGKKVTGLSAVRSEIASAVRQLKDPNIPDADKQRIAEGLVKTINMTQGTSDAIGAEEVGRLASELESSFPALGKAMMVGAGSLGTAGAAVGGGVGSLAGGVGAIPGAAIGGGAGALGGGLIGGIGAIANEMGKPSGFRTGPDIPGFTSRSERALEKVDATIRRQTRLQQLIGLGKTVPEANAIIDAEEGALQMAAGSESGTPSMGTITGNPSPPISNEPLPGDRTQKMKSYLMKKRGLTQ